MAKTEQNEKESQNQFNIVNGFIFGFGVFLANLLGFLILGLIVWALFSLI